MISLRTDFIPPVLDWAHTESLSIGTQSSRLTDALLLTSLPRKLKAHYPKLSVYNYARRFNRVVFYGDPNVSGQRFFPQAVWGDLARNGVDHPIQNLERYFGLPISSDPRPEIHLTDKEKAWALSFLNDHTLPENRNKPLCVIHPWHPLHSGHKQILPVHSWDRIVKRLQDQFRFWQVGIEDQAAIQGCEYYLLSTGRRFEARQFFAIISLARAFFGIDSAPMHAAKAFQVPSTIFINQAPGPHLYKDHTHIPVSSLKLVDVESTVVDTVNSAHFLSPEPR